MSSEDEVLEKLAYGPEGRKDDLTQKLTAIQAKLDHLERAVNRHEPGSPERQALRKKGRDLWREYIRMHRGES